MLELLFVIAIIALVIYSLYELIFFLCHQRALSKEEITKLSNIRKIKYINSHFSFSRSTYNINPKYRASLNVSGRWDKISISTKDVLSFLTVLLRYKRHEWTAFVLANESEAKYIWANKGDDNESCYYKGNLLDIVNLAKTSNCNTIIKIHNHPHTHDRYWNLLSPSDQDMKTFEILKQHLTKNGLNFIDALCTQGNFLIFGYCFDNYSPPNSNEEDILKENNISKFKNYKLHIEIRKYKNKRINL